MAATLPFFVLPLIFATIAIPSLLRARVTSNEAAAVQTLRVVGVAQQKYFSSEGRYGNLQELVTSDLLDRSFLQVNKGYRIALNLESDDYAAAAIPATNNTGRYVFYITREGVVRYSNEKVDAPPNLAGKPIP
jgi:type II secretory pathway pseudopilin PulG